MATNSAQGSGTGAAPDTVQEDPPPADAAKATADTSGTTADTATTSAMIGFSDGWPNWAKPVFALAVAAIWIGMPLVVAWSLSARTVQAGGVADYQPVLVVLVGMTTATITGIFVFMTFRIDRGTKLKAEEIAGKAAKEKLTEDFTAEIEKLNKAEKAARDTICKVDKEIEKKLAAETSPEKIRQKVAEHITKEKLQEHVKAMLMIDANVQAITASVQEQAKNLDPDAIERISKLLKEAADAWARSSEGEERTGWRFFGGWGRSRRSG